MKKRILTILTVLLIIPIFSGCMHRDPIEIDPFKNMEIEYSGWNGSGTAEVKNEINYTGQDETVMKLIDSISYQITPDNHLSNGDKITVEIRYVNDLKDLANVEFTKEQKKFTVKNLQNNDRTTIYKDETVEDPNGNQQQVTKEYQVINGVEIPSSWNLTEEEKQKYLAYIQGLDSGQSEEPGLETTWTQGTSESVTHRENSNFYNSDYLDNAVTCYQAAYDYGISSSQEFRIEPIIKDEKMVGYQCIFKE